MTQTRPKILHLYKDYFPPVRGGIEQTLNLMANGLKDRYDMSVLVCCGNESAGEFDMDGVRVIRTTEWGRFASAPLSWQYMRLLREELRRTDIVHLHHPNPTGDLALALAGSPHVPAVMTYHSDIVRQRLSKYAVAPLIHASMKRCRVVMPTSPDYAQSSPWLQRFANKLEIVPLGIDAQAFAPTAQSQAHTAEFHARAAGRRIIGFSGRLRYYKGLPWLIRAMDEIDNAVLFIGGGGGIRAELEALAQGGKSAESIVFAGDLTHDELVGLLYASDVFCMPSHLRSEALGISMIEAMMCGLPVVSCDIPSGVRFVNLHEETGLRVEPCNSHALATAINRLLTDDELRCKFGAAARRRALEVFSVQEMNRHLDEVYCRVLDQTKKAD